MAADKAVPDFERYKLPIQTHGDEFLQPGHDPASCQVWRRRRLLGAGGFGEVYQQVWKDEHYDSHYRAVKEFKEQTMQAKRIDYRRELSVLAAFSNSEYSGFFVNLHGWWIASGKVFIAMEYLRYGDLSRYATTGISEAESKAITRNVLQGLQVMHKHGFTHRDIKPQNVLVVQKRPEFPTWWVKIADFGISKQLFEGSDTALRTTVGSRGYCAPEVLEYLESDQHTSVYTSKIDIWSLGCVVFYIGSRGQIPFSDVELMKYCDGRGAFNPRNYPVNLKDSGNSFVRALLQVQPEERPTATEALQDSWLAEVDTTVSNTSSTVPPRSYPTLQQNFSSFLNSAPPIVSPLYEDVTDLKPYSTVVAPSKRKPVGSPESHSARQQNFNSFLHSGSPTASLPYHDRTDSTVQPVVATAIKEASPANDPAPRTSTKKRDVPPQIPYLQSETSHPLPAAVSRAEHTRQVTDSSNLLGTLSENTLKTAIPELLEFGVGTNALKITTGSNITREESQMRNTALDRWLKKNESEIRECRGVYGRTPVHVATYNGELEIVKALVKEGADIHAKDNNGRTPLYYAVLCGQLEMARWLKEQGADIHAKNNWGETPLDIARYRPTDNTEVVEYLQKQTENSVKEEQLSNPTRHSTRESASRVTGQPRSGRKKTNVKLSTTGRLRRFWGS